MKRRVVITGYDALLPGAGSKEELLGYLQKGENSFSKTAMFLEGKELEEYISEIKEFEQYKQSQRIDEDERLVRFAKKLVDNIKVQVRMDSANSKSIGLSFATSVAGSIHVENYLRKLPGNDSLREMNRFAENIAMYIGAKNINVNVCACAAGTIALGIGYDMVKHGENDMVVCIAAEALSSVTYQGFRSLKALSKSGCRPLMGDRDGLTLGEGGGAVAVEEYESAVKRGAQIYGEILGYGLSNDAYHISTPDPQGEGAVRAMKMALGEAEISPADIQYINLHGTGTIYNDAMEYVALKKVFGDELPKKYVSSTKGMTGHCLAATGLIEIVITMTLMEKQLLPGNYNTNVDEKDETFNDFTLPDKNRNVKADIFMSNSFAFGGNTSSIIVKKS